MIHRTPAAWLAGAAVAAAATVTIASATAQQAVPTVPVAASATAVTVGDGVTPIAPGSTRLNITRAASKRDFNVYVALLVPGVTIDQVVQALQKEEGTENTGSLGLVSLQAGAAFSAGETEHALTFTVKPGLTYYVIAEESSASGKVLGRAVTSFASGATANGAVAAAPDATVRFQGLRFRSPSTLPRTGTVRFLNRDGAAHFALAFPLVPGTTGAKLGKALKGDSEAAFGRLVAGPPKMLQNIISGGDTGNDQEITFSRPGRYGLVCFIDGHAQLGMYKVVTVR